MPRKNIPPPKKKEDRSLEGRADVIMKKSRRTKSPQLRQLPERKSRRTKGGLMKKTLKDRNPRFYNMGGHMIDPPETCMKQRSSEDGAWWVDLALCFHCTDKCDRYKDFIKMTPGEKAEDGLDRGIIEPILWKRGD